MAFKTDADEHHYVRMARWATVALMCVGASLTMVLDTAKATFDLILQIGAGTGALVHRPLVVVASECVERDRGDGRVL